MDRAKGEDPVRSDRYPLTREFLILLIRETTPAGYGASQQILSADWTDAEIARIRDVLQRLTIRRIRNDHDAEDLVQETLLTMTRKLPGTELQKGLLVWASGILRRKIGNYYKMARKSSGMEAESIISRESGCCGSMTGAQESKLHYKELRAIIESLLQSLPKQERQAIDLLLRGLRTQEIAAEMSPERYQSVANYLHRGRRKVKRALARYGYLPLKRPRMIKAGRRKVTGSAENKIYLK
jgi:RNA polymerase sigma factor (sigma-70 family)